jgi:hypothetical protein
LSFYTNTIQLISFLQCEFGKRRRATGRADSTHAWGPWRRTNSEALRSTTGLRETARACAIHADALGLGRSRSDHTAEPLTRPNHSHGRITPPEPPPGHDIPPEIVPDSGTISRPTQPIERAGPARSRTSLTVERHLRISSRFKRSRYRAGFTRLT